jgi:hypothetical protein
MMRTRWSAPYHIHAPTTAHKKGQGLRLTRTGPLFRVVRVASAGVVRMAQEFGNRIADAAGSVVAQLQVRGCSGACRLGK